MTADDADTSHALRPCLHKIAHRRTPGPVVEAEGIVRDVQVRRHDAARNRIENADAWLVAVTTRPR